MAKEISMRCETAEVTHICMPALSLTGLLAISVSVKKTNRFLHYDILPRYLRGVSRIFKISYQKIELLLSVLSGMTIQKVKHGDDVKGYRDFHIGTQETVSVIAEKLLQFIEGDRWFSEIESLIGREPALSYAIKQLADRHMFNQLVALISCYISCSNNGNYIVAWHPYWPKKWLDIIKNDMPSLKFEFFKWPWWYLFPMRVLFYLSILLKILLAGLLILKRGIRKEEAEKKRYKIITEFVDPKRFNNTCYDVDYWVDRAVVNKNDIFFFLTQAQMLILKKTGYNIKQILEQVKSKGYDIKCLDCLPYPLKIIKESAVVVSGIFKNLVYKRNLLLGNIFFQAWSEYLDFYPLFSYYSSDNFIYLTFPNGHTGLRYNSGIVTGLCRKNGIRSVGCQTRAIHSRNYEYCFDCFDLYLAWGRRWYEMMKDGIKFINKWQVVGCTYLDFLIETSRKRSDKKKGYSDTEKLNVCIFPTDISPMHHYSLNYALSFMKNCVRLALTYPDVNFLIKNKEPQYTNIIMADDEFMALYQKTNGNFNFVERFRHEYTDLLLSSDIIIAMGFTTPGTEGLLLGKRVIYYNELQYGGQAFVGIPDLIANNFDELRDIFSRALDDYINYTDTYKVDLDKLDPFRDGQALKRIHNQLFSAVR